MIRLLEQIRLGSAKPYTLKHSRHTQKIDKLDASNMKVLRGLDLSLSYKEIRFLQPDPVEGKFLLAALSDGGFLMYNVQDKDLTSYLVSDPMWTVARHQNGGSGHSNAIQCAEWYPDDNKMFATGGEDKGLKLWDCSRMTVVHGVTLEGGVGSFDFSPVLGCQTLIAIGMDVPKIVMFDTRCTEKTLEFTDEQLTSCTLSLCWSPIDSNLLASAGSDSRAFLWDVRKHSTPVMRLDFLHSSPNEEMQNLGDVESYLRPTARFPVLAMKFTRNGTNLLTYSKDCVKLWNAKSGEDLQVDFGKLPEMYFPGPRPVQIDILEGSDPPHIFIPANRSVQVHNLNTGVKEKTFGDHYAQVTCCSYNKTNMEMYSASLDGSVIVWRDDREHSRRYKEEIGEIPDSLFEGHPGYPRRRHLYRSSSRVLRNARMRIFPGHSVTERRNGAYAQQYIRIRRIRTENVARHGFYIGEVDYAEEQENSS